MMLPSICVFAYDCGIRQLTAVMLSEFASLSSCCETPVPPFAQVAAASSSHAPALVRDKPRQTETDSKIIKPRTR